MEVCIHKFIKHILKNQEFCAKIKLVNLQTRSEVLKQEEITALFDRFSGISITVCGDIMLDKYIHGKVDRISPEAPVPVVDVTQKNARPGGAGNVAVNLVAMGARVRICSVTGNDENGDHLIALLSDAGVDTSGIIRSHDRVTTTKTRVLGNHHQMLRIDEENTHFLPPDEEASVKAAMQTALNQSDGLLFQDYDKGVLTPEIIRYGTETANQIHIPITVDPKFRSFDLFRHVTLFKPNLKELRAGLQLSDLGKSTDDLVKADRLLREKLEHRFTLITLSEKGMFGQAPEGYFITPAHVRNIADVSGAGDTVIAIATLCLAAGSEFRTAVEIANLAGGLVCESPGVVPVNRDQLLEEALQKLCVK